MKSRRNFLIGTFKWLGLLFVANTTTYSIGEFVSHRHGSAVAAGPKCPPPCGPGRMCCGNICVPLGPKCP